LAAAAFVAASVSGLIFLCGGIGYAVRNRVELVGGVLTVTNLWRTYRIPLVEVVAAVPLPNGVAFRVSDGRFCQARALELTVYGRWEFGGSRAVARSAAGELKAAAEQVRRERGIDLDPARLPSPKVGFVRRMMVSLSFGFFGLVALLWAVMFSQIFKR
jgi:hypothetical protein